MMSGKAFSVCAVLAAAVSFGAADEAFTRLDKNGDGVLTRDETGERIGKIFDRLDTDKDGKLTPKEFEAVKSLGATNAPGAVSGTNAMNAAQLFARLDKNRDGALSRDEAGEKLAKAFDSLDTDKNGTISMKEFEASLAKYKQTKKSGSEQ